MGEHDVIFTTHLLYFLFSNLGHVEILLLPLLLVEGRPLHHWQVAVRDDQRDRTKHHLIRMVMMLMVILTMMMIRMMMMLLIILNKKIYFLGQFFLSVKFI